MFVSKKSLLFLDFISCTHENNYSGILQHQGNVIILEFLFVKMMIQGRDNLGLRYYEKFKCTTNTHSLIGLISNDSMFPASDDSRLQYTLPQVPVVQTLDSAIHQINHYLANKY